MNFRLPYKNAVRGALLAFIGIPSVYGAPVINEIHYNPPDNSIRLEFIEIYNPGPKALNLGGWRLSSAVDYLFPESMPLLPGAYLVVSEDPAVLSAIFGISSLGPWTGKLSSDGETVRLRDGTGAVADEADYKVGFPWPVAADGSGSSIELINHSLRNELGSSWRGSEGSPTPGRANSVFAANAPPSIRKVAHSPRTPRTGEPIRVTARVTDPDGVATVALEYQVVAPGSYIPSRLPHPIVRRRIPAALTAPETPLALNPAYSDPSNWTTLPMHDDGTGGDDNSGDGIFSVEIPSQSHRTLLRYRITVEDGLNLATRVPYPDDAALNFACFVYDGVPDYNGHPADDLTRLPVYHVITRDEDWRECYAWSSNNQINQGSGNKDRHFYNWTGTFVYDDIVYDNIRYRLRGANGRYQKGGKRSMRFRFNKGYYMQARRQDGTPFEQKWRTLTTGKGFENRGTLTYSLNEALSMHLWNTIGLPAQDTLWTHLRVIDGADEAPDQWRGDFWGLQYVVETYDVRFLEEHGLPKGNLYKLINQERGWERQQRYQAVHAPTDGSDHDNIENNLTGNSSASFIRSHVDLEKYYLYHGLSEAIRNYDFWPSANKNMAYYFYPDYNAQNGGRGKLWILPWDSDATWGPTFNRGHDVVYNSIFPSASTGGDPAFTPDLWPEYYNTVRELRDLLWQEDQINPLIEEFAEVIAPMIPADSDRWKNAPPDAGNYNALFGKGAISLDALVQDLKDFAFFGGSWPGENVGPGGRAAHLDSLQVAAGEDELIPATPIIAYTGDVGFPSDGLVFESSAYNDPQGDHTFAGMEWRVAEVSPLGTGVTTILPAGSEWKYLDDGSDQGTIWREPAFDDQGWASGGTPAGYGGITGVTAFRTSIDFGGINNDRHETTYFRRGIHIEDPSMLDYIEFGLHLDDGAVVYVNGSEVIRDGFNPDSVVTYDTLADSSGNEGVFDRYRISPSLFLPGENIIAVELHQRTRGSSDLVFDMEVLIKEPLVPAGKELQLEWKPIWESGEQGTFTARQEIPIASIRPNRDYRARVRHLDDTGRWSHWSDPLEFRASEPDTTPYAESIVISELMYHPSRATPAELELGYNDESFEFIEITNIGNSTIDLTGLRFTKGVDFDFLGSDLTSLEAGARALVVANKAAFESRYGTDLLIAGEWESGDRLSNGGERIKLSYGAGVSIRDFDYSDQSPWPSSPDGGGPALTLINPRSNPDHKNPANWRPSNIAGGSPGGEDSTTFASWAAGFGLSIDSPATDTDTDTLGIFREYAQGGSPLAALAGEGLFDIKLEDVVIDKVAVPHLILTVARNLAADDVAFRIETNADLPSEEWEDVTSEFVWHSETQTVNGQSIVRYRSSLLVEEAQYWRIKFLLR